MTTIEPLTERRIRDLERQRDELTDQRDRAEALFRVEEERNEKALRLHDVGKRRFDGMSEPYCWTCSGIAPCATRRALTGADEDSE